MRRLLPFIAALLLGVGAAVLVACGSGTKDGIPADRADRLSSAFEDVRQAVSGGRCDAVEGQRSQVDQQIDSLPRSVDPQLRERLRQASDNLRLKAVDECNSRVQETTTEEPVTETEPETQTETQPTETTTLPPEDTTTEPPPIETAPDDTGTLPPPGTPEPPPDQDTVPAPGGGTEPELFP